MSNNNILNKNNLTSIDIEKRAINKINKLCEHNLLISHISSNDKTVSFDGTIEVYNNFEKKIEDLYNIIDVQVKGKYENFDDEELIIKYSLKRNDLNNFKMKGGILFFVCLINDDSVRVYYKELYVDIIDKILLKMKKSNNMSKSVEFHLLDENNNDSFYYLLKRFSYRVSKYRKYNKIELSNLYNYNINKLQIMKCSDDTNIIAFIEENKKPFYVVNDVNKINFEIENLYVFINNEKYYSNEFGNLKFVQSLENKENYLQLGKCIKLYVDKMHVSINEDDNLYDVFYDLNFLFDLSKNSKIEININEEKKYFDYDINFDKYEEFFNKLMSFKNNCDFLMIDMKNLKYKYFYGDFETINTFVNKEKLNEALIQLLELSERFYPFIVTNGKFSNFNNKIERFCGIVENIKYDVPKYLIFDEDILLNLFIDEDMLIEDIKMSLINIKDDVHFSLLNNYLLKLIILFDKTDNLMFLNAAEYLAIALNESKFISDCTLLNLLQIKYRKNNSFENYYIDKLNNILLNSNKYVYSFAAAVLLNNKEKAIKYFNKFTKDEKRDFLELPIMNLFNKI